MDEVFDEEDNSEELNLSAKEFSKRLSDIHKAGLREGAAKGQDIARQCGFEAAYKAVVRGKWVTKLGEIRGALAAAQALNLQPHLQQQFITCIIELSALETVIPERLADHLKDQIDSLPEAEKRSFLDRQDLFQLPENFRTEIEKIVSKGSDLLQQVSAVEEAEVVEEYTAQHWNRLGFCHISTEQSWLPLLLYFTRSFIVDHDLFNSKPRLLRQDLGISTPVSSESTEGELSKKFEQIVLNAAAAPTASGDMADAGVFVTLSDVSTDSSDEDKEAVQVSKVTEVEKVVVNNGRTGVCIPPPSSVDELPKYDDPEEMMMQAMGLPVMFAAGNKYTGEDVSSDEDSARERKRQKKRKPATRSPLPPKEAGWCRAAMREAENAFEKHWEEHGDFLTWMRWMKKFGKLAVEESWRAAPHSVQRRPEFRSLAHTHGVELAHAEHVEPDPLLMRSMEDVQELHMDAETDWDALWESNRCEAYSAESQRFTAAALSEAAPEDEDNSKRPKKDFHKAVYLVGLKCDSSQTNGVQPRHSKYSLEKGVPTASKNLDLISAKGQVDLDDDGRPLQAMENEAAWWKDADASLPVEETDHELPFDKDPALRKYWSQRYRLFSRFDEGIKLDRESWFSVTPERIAQHQAERCRSQVLLDAFCGAGGNAVHFAKACTKVVAMDIDPAKIAIAKHNAAVYGVQDRIEFICGDFFQLAPAIQADAVFLSPPWGGPEYLDQPVYDLSQLPLGDHTMDEMMSTARQVSNNIALFVPRNTNVGQLVALARPGESVEIEQNMLNRRMKTLTVYYNELVDCVTENY